MTMLNTIIDEYSPKIYENEGGRLIVYPERFIDSDEETIKSDHYSFSGFRFGTGAGYESSENIKEKFFWKVARFIRFEKNQRNNKRNWTECPLFDITNITIENDVPFIEINADCFTNSEEYKELLKHVDVKAVPGNDGSVHMKFEATGRSRNLIRSFYPNLDKTLITCLKCGKVKFVPYEEIIKSEKIEGRMYKFRRSLHEYECSCGNKGEIRYAGSTVASSVINGLSSERVVIRERNGKSPQVQLEQDKYTFVLCYPNEPKDEWYIPKKMDRKRFTFNTDRGMIYFTAYHKSFTGGKICSKRYSVKALPFDNRSYEFSSRIMSMKNLHLLGKIFNVPEGSQFSREYFTINYGFRPFRNDKLFEQIFYSPVLFISKSKKEFEFLKTLRKYKTEEDILKKAGEYPKMIRKKIYRMPSLLYHLKGIKDIGFTNVDVIDRLLDRIIDFEMRHERITNDNFISSCYLSVEHLRDVMKRHGDIYVYNIMARAMDGKTEADSGIVCDAELMYNNIRSIDPALLLARNGKPITDIKDWNEIHQELSLISNKLKTADLPIETPKKVRKRLEFESDDMIVTFPTHTHELVDIGVNMSICVGGSQYQTMAALGNGYIMYAAEKKTGRYVACIELGKKLDIRQLKGYHNGLIEDPYRDELLEWVDETQIDTYGCFDVSRNRTRQVIPDNEMLQFA